MSVIKYNIADFFLDVKIEKRAFTVLKGAIGIAPAAARMMEGMAKAAQSIQVTNNNMKAPQVSVRDINVHMDGAGVIDPKSFCETFRRSNEMQRAIQDATINQIGKPYCNTLF